ncbi:MAG: hypothetical protein NTZ93_00135 [Candidatus Beckwithbacteria bacterium]|nr:hypothetical protein [Candidatus Beckwithbacteria bacterium]
MPNNLINIKFGKTTLALIIKANFKAKPHQFLTKPDNPLQLGVNFYPKGRQVKPHQHRRLAKTTHKNQEFIYLVSGQIEATFFYKGRTFVKHILNPGDCLLQFCGGHGFKFLKPTKLITIKQGPYSDRQHEKIEI